MLKLQEYVDKITTIISKETLAIILAISSHVLFPLGFLYTS